MNKKKFAILGISHIDIYCKFTLHHTQMYIIHTYIQYISLFSTSIFLINTDYDTRLTVQHELMSNNKIYFPLTTNFIYFQMLFKRSNYNCYTVINHIVKIKMYFICSLVSVIYNSEKYEYKEIYILQTIIRTPP